MIIRYSAGVRQEVGHYVGTIFNSIAGGWPGGVPSPGTVSETINPASLTIAVNGSATFTANLPANWTATHGSLVVAGNHLSAVYTAPGSPTLDTVTATNMNDPGNLASAPVNVTTSGPTSAGEIVGQDGTVAGRGMIQT